MNIYTPTPMQRADIPREQLAIIDSRGSLADFRRRSLATINLPHHVDDLLSRPHDINGLERCNVTTVDCVAFRELCKDYQIDCILDQVTAFVTLDVASNVPHIVVPSDFLADSVDDPSYFDSVMFHESIHIDQIARSDFLIDVLGGRFVWKGQEMRMAMKASEVECLLAEYADIYPDAIPALRFMMAEMKAKPWELEAHYLMFERMGSFKRLPNYVCEILNTYQK
jgi:hypothetical protein